MRQIRSTFDCTFGWSLNSFMNYIIIKYKIKCSRHEIIFCIFMISLKKKLKVIFHMCTENCIYSACFPSNSYCILCSLNAWLLFSLSKPSNLTWLFIWPQTVLLLCTLKQWLANNRTTLVIKLNNSISSHDWPVTTDHTCENLYYALEIICYMVAALKFICIATFY